MTENSAVSVSEEERLDKTQAVLGYVALAGVCAVIIGIVVVFWMLGA